MCCASEHLLCVPKGWFARGWLQPLVGCASLVGCAVLVGSSLWLASVASGALVGFLAGWLLRAASPGWLFSLVGFVLLVGFFVALSHCLPDTLMLSLITFSIP